MKGFFLTTLSILVSFLGFAQQIDSLSKKSVDYQSVTPTKFRVAPYILPAVLITYGVIASNTNGALKRLDISTKDELQEDHPLFAAHVDDYL